MSPAQIIGLVAFGISLLSILLYLIPGPCVCEKCGYHVNERRMAKERQKELSHDVTHKGYAFKTGAPDKYHCPDAECDRNPRKVVD